MPYPPEIGETEAFEELFALLRAIASGHPADRSEAVRYSTCRAALLASGAKSSLPGFLRQCMSVARFRDFITLYDPDPSERERFVRKAFELTRDRYELSSAFDLPPEAASESDWQF